MRPQHLWGIDPENAEAAFGNAAVSARRAKVTAHIIRKIAAAHDGMFINSASAEKIISEFPEWEMHYRKSEKSIYIYERDGIASGCGATVGCVTLVEKDAKRISAAAMILRAERYEHRANQINAALESFYANVQQFNVIAAALRSVTESLDTIMYCGRGW